MSESESDPLPEMDDDMQSSVDFPGPFSQHDVLVKGRCVPFLHMQPLGESEITLTLDHRFGLELSVLDAERVVPFIADCIAVALGYTCHPDAKEEPLRSDPFSRRVTIIGFGDSSLEPPDA